MSFVNANSAFSLYSVYTLLKYHTVGSIMRNWNTMIHGANAFTQTDTVKKSLAVAAFWIAINRANTPASSGESVPTWGIDRVTEGVESLYFAAKVIKFLEGKGVKLDFFGRMVTLVPIWMLNTVIHMEIRSVINFAAYRKALAEVQPTINREAERRVQMIESLQAVGEEMAARVLDDQETLPPSAEERHAARDAILARDAQGENQHQVARIAAMVWRSHNGGPVPS